jgi:hypothetical protein
MTGRSFHYWLFLLISFTAVSGCQNMSLNRTTAGYEGSGGNRRCSDFPMVSDEAVARSINVSVERLAALKVARSLTNNDICTMPDEGLKRALYRLDHPKADHPGEWAEFRNLQRRSQDGKVKPDGLIKGIKHRKDHLKKYAKKVPSAANAADAANTAGGEIVAPAAGVTSNQWTALGPSAVGGRIRAILIDPTNTSNLWLGSVSGGIWHSTDGGASWTPANDFMGNLSVSSLVMDPNNTDIIYAGTGEGFHNSDGVRGAGVFKSTDGGVTWNSLPSTTPSSNVDSPAYGWYYVNRLAMTNNGSAILTATRGYYLGSGSIFRSTDGGATWSERYSGGKVWDVRFDPNNPNKALAVSVGYNSDTSQSETYLIRSDDAGQTWGTVQTFVNTGRAEVAGRIELAYAKSNSQIVYASRDNASGEVWKSIDGGGSWSLLSTPQHLGTQGWYDNTIWVDPTDASHVVVGGLDLWRSTNGGVNWTKISNWSNNMYGGYPNVPHADHHVLVADPNYDGTGNRTLYNGNDGGIFRAADITLATQTSGWETLNHGLSITQFYSGAGHTAAGGKIIGGTQDNGSQLQTAEGAGWKMFFGGDGGYSAVDSQNDNYLYGEYTYLQLHRSTNGGATQSTWIYNGITDKGLRATANFIAPFILDPNDNNRLLAGGASLWQSLAVKAPVPQWTAIKPPIGNNISAIAVTPGNSSVAWVGHNDGSLYRSSNSLASPPTWTQVGASILPGRMVRCILIDKDDTNKLYVSFGGYDANLYRSTDNGANWSDITGTLPAVPIFTITRHPANGNWLYAGTEVGLFSSEDGGTSWYTTNDGPANVEISELSWLDDSTLLAATHGRGMFKITVSDGSDVTPPSVSATTPADNANGVALGIPITASFSEPMNAASITTASFTLSNGVTGSVSYNASTRVATFTPSGLAYGTTYTATVTTAVRDVAGNPMTMAKVWTFTTMPPPPVSEAFSGGSLPAGWTIVDNVGNGAVWRFDNPLGRTNTTGGTGGFAIADSDYAGAVAMNTELRSPVIDLSAFGSATLSFKTDYYHNNTDIADVDISTNGANGQWTNVWRKFADYRGPITEQIDISAIAAGSPSVMVRFHYFNAVSSWYWEVDDVTVYGTSRSHVRLLNPGPTSYPSLQAAYNNAAATNIIQAEAANFTEDLVIFNDVAVSLKGGFDAAFADNTGWSTVNGVLKVKNGTAKLDKIKFR